MIINKVINKLKTSNSEIVLVEKSNNIFIVYTI